MPAVQNDFFLQNEKLEKGGKKKRSAPLCE
jgi:hypothetical protein